MKWTKNKPVEAGAYWVIGNNFKALVEVAEGEGELICNLHERNSDEDCSNWFVVNDLDGSFEWLGPLYPRED